MVKVRRKKEREVIHNAGCNEVPCECGVRRTSVTTGQEIYEAIKNPIPTHIVHDKSRNVFRHDEITEIFTYA